MTFHAARAISVPLVISDEARPLMTTLKVQVPSPGMVQIQQLQLVSHWSSTVFLVPLTHIHGSLRAACPGPRRRIITGFSVAPCWKVRNASRQLLYRNPLP